MTAAARGCSYDHDVGRPVCQGGAVLTPYRQLAAVPRLAAVLGWGLFGRLHLTCTSISLTFLVAGWTGSYAIAGLVVAAATLGWGVGGPLRGRAADRSHPARQLLVTGVLYSAGMGTIAMLPDGMWLLATVLAFATGLAVPATGQISRAMYPRMASGPALHAAYTVEATLQELVFILGPTMAAGTVALAGPRAAVWLCAVLALLGAIGFAVQLYRMGELGGPLEHRASPDGDGRLFAVPGLAAAIGTALLMVATFTSVSLALVAWARDRGSPVLAGVLVATWATGSMIGGLVSGGLPGRRPPRLWLRAAALAAGVSVLPFVLPPVAGGVPPLMVAAVLLVGGTAIAPASATSNALVGLLAPGHRRSEAFGWMATARTSGNAVAGPTAGALMDASGPASATMAATVFALAAVALAATVRTPQAPEPDAAAVP